MREKITVSKKYDNVRYEKNEVANEHDSKWVRQKKVNETHTDKCVLCNLCVFMFAKIQTIFYYSFVLQSSCWYRIVRMYLE